MGSQGTIVASWELCATTKAEIDKLPSLQLQMSLHLPLAAAQYPRRMNPHLVCYKISALLKEIQRADHFQALRLQTEKSMDCLLHEVAYHTSL
jgi:hypothetical protein